jgi:hypothetical protein
MALERASLIALAATAALFLLFFFRDYEFSLWFFGAFLIGIPAHIAASLLLATRRPRGLRSARPPLPEPSSHDLSTSQSERRDA